MGIIILLITALFLLLNSSSVQNYVKDRIVEELKGQIGSEFGISKLSITPFNGLELDSVYLYDQSGEKVFLAKDVYASVDLLGLLENKLVISSVNIDSFGVYLSKDSTAAPLNIQYIIDAFKSPEPKKKNPKIDLKISTVHLTNGTFEYSVKDKDKQNKFDPNHIAVSNLNARLSLKSLTPDSLNIQVKKLSLNEQSGLKIKNLTTRIITQKEKAWLKGFRLDLPESFLQFDRFAVDLTDSDKSKNFLDNIAYECIITPSYISPKDIAAIAPELQYFNDLISIEASISGTGDDITVSDFTFDYKGGLHLISNIEVKGLRDKDQMYILGSVDNLTTNGKELKGFIRNFSKNDIRLPESITNLKHISFQGDISGYLTELVAFGTIESDFGIINTDVLFGFNPDKHTKAYYKGKVFTSDFEIGKLANNKDLNKTSLDLAIDLRMPVHGYPKGKLEGVLFDFDYKGYSYADLNLDMSYDGLKLEGSLDIDDEYGFIALNGLFDLTDKDRPKLDFEAQVRSVQLNKLQLTDATQFNMSFNMKANFEGKTIDDAHGSVLVDSINIIQNNKRANIDNLSIEALGESSDRQLTIKSDFLNGKIVGAYSFTTMANSIQQTLYTYFPALIKEVRKDKRTASEIKENNLIFDFRINNTQNLTEVFNLPVTVLSQAKITGFYNNLSNKLRLEAFVPAIIAGGANIRSGYVLVENPFEEMKSKIEGVMLNKNGSKNQVEISSTATMNKVDTKISFVNDLKKAKGDFGITTLFDKEKDTDPLKMSFAINPSSLMLNGEEWEMGNAKIFLENKEVRVENFYGRNKDGSQQLRIGGKYSAADPSSILKIELDDINLDYIFETLAIDAVHFGGIAKGNVFLSSIEGKPYANTRLDVKNFSFNKTPLGHLDLFSELDEITNVIMMDGKITSPETKMTYVKGSLDPINQKLSFNFDADSVDVSFLHKYTQTIFSQIGGRGTGKVRLHGDFSNVTVEGYAYIKNGILGITFLNTDYTFSDYIHMKDNLIYFNDLSMYDNNGNKAVVSGKVAHDRFKDISYYIDLNADKLLLYNVSEKQNPILSGRVFGSGKGSISGDENVVDINIGMRTEDNTFVRMNFMEESSYDYNFIEYKTKEQPATDTIAELAMDALTQPIQTKSEMEINMNFYIDATPTAVAEIVMDPVGGDVLRGSGSGALRFTWSSKAAPRLYGTYSINRGSYLFTFQRIMERKFNIEDGSTVLFKGDPFEAELDVSATYKITANLNDLNSMIAETAGQTNIPVECILHLTGPLKHPNVGLDLNFPSAVPEVERQLKVLLNSEDMINRQVAYLLLLSKFYTPEDNSASEYKTSDFAALASATLSSQLSKIVSKIDNRFQLGTNIRTSDPELTSTEVELILSSQLLNDRLLINGNFGYRDDPSTQTNDEFIRDVEIEYLLNPSGTWRIKAYNRYNEKYYYTGSATETQGVGIKYKKDFDNLHELLPWLNKIKLKPEHKKDSLEVVLPDSTVKGSGLGSFIKLKK